MPEERPEISIITSMYNEGESAREFVDAVMASARKHTDDFEIVIADNASTDGTPKICDEMAQVYPELKVVHVPQPNTGKGRGVRYAVEGSRGKYIAYIDADLQQEPDDIFMMLDKLKREGYGILVGQRTQRNDPLARKILSRGYNGLCRLLFRLPIPDIGGQPKVMSAEIFEGQKIISDRWLIELELPLMAVKKGLKTGHVPVRHNPRKTGKSKIKMATVLEMFSDLIKMRVGWK